MTSKQVTKLLRGKTIDRVDLRTQADLSAGGSPMQDVQIFLSDGTSLTFATQEPADGGDYGVSMCIYRKGEAFFSDRSGGKVRK